MDWWQAIVLGIVEGLTEYLPISSTGHLLVAQRAMGIPEDEASNAFAICIQAGAIVAVLGLYWAEVRRMLAGLVGVFGGRSPEDENGLRLLCNIVIAFLPAAVIGLLFDDLIEQHLFGLVPVIWAWFVGGVIIIIFSWYRARSRSVGKERTLDQLTWQGALAIGLMQCLAMLPGTSRSLATILGGVLVGLGISAAVEFSFLLGVLTLLAATAYKTKDAGPVMFAQYSWPILALSTLSAWLSAVLAVKWMVGYLRKHDIRVFGYYRIGLAVIVGGLVYWGVVRE